MQFECCVISVLKERAVSPPLLLQQQLRHGSHQEEDRAKEVFQSKADENATYDGVAKKLATCEGDLEKAEERADVGEDRIIELEGELRVVANLKSLEVAEEKANQREKTYKEQLMMYVNCLKLVDVQKVRPG